MTSREQFGLLSGASDDLADESQALAASLQLPRVHQVIDRDDPLRLEHPTRVIFNGCHARRPDLWPPDHPKLIPLLLSVHLSERGGSSHTTLLSPRGRDFLLANAPVGCRDTATLELLESHDVPAYFSGCLTLTFPESTRTRSDRVVMVDVPPVLRSRLPEDITQRATILSTGTSSIRGLSISQRLHLGRTHRFVAARRLLRLYSGAGLVATTRLHVALSATALGTPAILLMPDPDDPRLSGLKDFVHCRTTPIRDRRP